MRELTLDQVSYQYKGAARPALNNVSCSFSEGQVSVILGPSGSGKTTLLSLLAGLDRPSLGKISLDGRDLAAEDMDRYRQKDISLIFQAFQLFPLLTVLENVCYPMELNGVSRKDAQAQAKRLLKQVGIGEEKYRRYPSRLSGGEQQRVAIARALAKNPKLLLCDEPTGALDYNTGKAILKLLQDTSRSTGMTVIIITHNKALCAMADRVIRVKSGTICSVQKNEEIIPVEEIEW